MNRPKIPMHPDAASCTVDAFTNSSYHQIHFLNETKAASDLRCLQRQQNPVFDYLNTVIRFTVRDNESRFPQVFLLQTRRTHL